LLPYHHSNVLPAFAVIADEAISDANRTITVPDAEGVRIPSITAMFPVVAAVAELAAAGISYAFAKLVVIVVAFCEYLDA